MRAWPPIQILLALLLLGGAAWTLRHIGAARAGAGTGDAVSEPLAEPASSTIDLRLEGTVPFRIEALRWGSEETGTPAQSLRSWSTRFSASGDGPLVIEGETADDGLPAALRVEIDRHGFPGVEKILWIRANPFTRVVPWEVE
ncbi:MAG: hypothetical protein ACLFRP_09080 [Puniceicoccaceae bacterium]